MTGNEFWDRIRTLARRNSLHCRLDLTAGKGSHAKLFLGDRHTILKDRRKELGKGLLSKMCRDLGITTRDLSDR